MVAILKAAVVAAVTAAAGALGALLAKAVAKSLTPRVRRWWRSRHDDPVDAERIRRQTQDEFDDEG